MPQERRTWGWGTIFNVWSNAAQSLFGYTLAASLFLNYGLSGWTVFAAIIVAGLIIVALVNFVGVPSVRHGIPYPVMARAGMGVFGANFPAVLRGVVAIFWYGAQTYIASTAVSLVIISLFGAGPPGLFLGLNLVSWIALIVVSVFQVAVFWRGIETIRGFLNFAAPAVYAVMVALLVVLWVRAGKNLLPEAGKILAPSTQENTGSVRAFLMIVGTMIAFYAPIIVNFGDFSRYVRSPAQMKKGNLIGLAANITVFALIALLITAGTVAVFGEKITDPTQIIARVNDPVLTVIAALTFFIATVGINVVANFVPPANDLSNLMPGRISFRAGGMIAAAIAFVISALWVVLISQAGIERFVNTLGALLAPAYGVLITDYYVIKRQRLEIEHMYIADPNGTYYYQGGWNLRALAAFAIGAVFSVLGVWLPALEFLSGFDWILGALLTGVLYWWLARNQLRTPY